MEALADPHFQFNFKYPLNIERLQLQWQPISGGLTRDTWAVEQIHQQPAEDSTADAVT